MKVQQLIDQLSFIPPNYDVMVKVGDSERDLITKIGSINCVNSKINPPSGFIELETCNVIDWLRASYNEAIPKDQYEARLKTDMVDMLKELKEEIAKLKSYESSDGQDLVMLADVGILFNQKISALNEENTNDK